MPGNDPVLSDRDRRASHDRVEPQASSQIPCRLVRNELDLGGIEPFNVLDGREEDGLLVTNQG